MQIRAGPTLVSISKRLFGNGSLFKFQIPPSNSRWRQWRDLKSVSMIATHQGRTRRVQCPPVPIQPFLH